MVKSRISAWAILLCLFLFVGCQSLKEAAKGIAGTSTKELEKGRASAIAQNFDYDYFTCFTRTLDILKEAGAYIYSQDIKKHMIAVYISEKDTTPVGIFFKEVSPGSVQVEVSSSSTYAKELISKQLFQALVKDMEEKKGESDEKK